jgi:hypothetical protein
LLAIRSRLGDSIFSRPAAVVPFARPGARTVQVQVRYGDFTTRTRPCSVEEPLTDARDLDRLGCWLLGREQRVHRPLRRLGLGMSGLGESVATQLVLPLQSGKSPL